jgi:hypothetical protein
LRCASTVSSRTQLSNTCPVKVIAVLAADAVRTVGGSGDSPVAGVVCCLRELASYPPLSNLGEAEMTPRHEISVARALSIRELEALAILREIRELGAFVLIDVDGGMCIYHRVQVPSLLKSRLAAYRTEATRLLLECAR